MRKHLYFLAFTALQGIILSAFFAWSVIGAGQGAGTMKEQMGRVVKELGLTDFSIWTEARYTRHPSQADRFTPFQDFPSSLEHFPAGSIIAPPRFSAAGTAGQIPEE